MSATATRVLSPDDAARLVAAAAAGDRSAWNALVDAYEGLIWSIARGHRLAEGDAGDVCQTVWLRLVEHIDRLKDPARVGAWLVTTTKRECLRVKAQGRRTVPLGEREALEPWQRENAEVDVDIVREETVREVRAALAELPERWRELLSRLMADPSPSYQEVAEALEIPIGSIGPTRGRCLRKLRDALATSAV